MMDGGEALRPPGADVILRLRRGKGESSLPAEGQEDGQLFLQMGDAFRHPGRGAHQPVGQHLRRETPAHPVQMDADKIPVQPFGLRRAVEDAGGGLPPDIVHRGRGVGDEMLAAQGALVERLVAVGQLKRRIAGGVGEQKCLCRVHKGGLLLGICSVYPEL